MPSGLSVYLPRHLSSTARLNTTEPFKPVHMAQIIPSILSKPHGITHRSVCGVVVALLVSSSIINQHQVLVPSLAPASGDETVQPRINPGLYPLIRGRDGLFTPEKNQPSACQFVASREDKRTKHYTPLVSYFTLIQVSKRGYRFRSAQIYPDWLGCV